MFKKVYLLHNSTKEYLGEYNARESPREKGVFHTPIDSTDIEPPAFVSEKIQVWDGSRLTVEDDFRGQFWYRVDGEQVEITDIGAPQGLQREAPQAPVVTVFERQSMIDGLLENNEPLRLIVESIEDANGLSRGRLAADAKTKVV